MQHDSRRRKLGSFYTPDWLARWMVARALPGCDQCPADFSARILDPACGDGAFILPVLDWIAARSQVSQADVPRRLAIVREHVFGVDADPPAIAALRRRVADWIGPDPIRAAEIADLLASNFLCGDALIGDDWSAVMGGPEVRDPRGVVAGPSVVVGAGDVSAAISSSASLHAPPICWATAFPLVAAAGGFDLVIGNPPYLRERSAKADFDRIADSTLGRRWRTARMDLWHYFFHRGLDLLKPKGRLAFIVNSYWTSAVAATRLRERMSAQASIEEIVLFGSARLFRDVSGRHMIFRVCKAVDPQVRCNVLDLSDLRRDEIEGTLTGNRPDPIPVRSVTQSALWSGGKLRADLVSSGDPAQVSSPRQQPTLGEQFEVRQGIAENPPFVTKSAALELDDLSLAGQGVFVLTTAEVAALQLSPQEHQLLRPYYALSAIGRFRVAAAPSHQLLYLTKQTAPELTVLPRIAAHLARFRVVLLRRREVQSGRIAWWHLHWPREERLFIAPRILSLQMGPEPRFAYAEQPTYVGFSMHMIVDRQAPFPTRTMSLATLTAILNSSRARRWFETHAKRRGVHLDISGAVLKQFPLPSEPRAEIAAELDRLTRTWPATQADTHLESRLNELVDML